MQQPTAKELIILNNLFANQFRNCPKGFKQRVLIPGRQYSEITYLKRKTLHPLSPEYFTGLQSDIHNSKFKALRPQICIFEFSMTHISL